MLIARGLPAGAPPEGWVLERPEEVAAVHRAYAEAGSEAVHATTFGAHPMRLARFGLRDRCAEINAEAVRLARGSGAAFVFGDIGPTGEYLPPVGTADPEAMAEGYHVQARALLAAGVDAFHLETMTDLREARIALGALRAESPETPILASMTFEKQKRGFFTLMGDPLIDSLRSLADLGAEAVGANCSLTSREIAPLVQEALAAIRTPLVVQPNAGQPEFRGEEIRYAQTPEEFAEEMAVFARSPGIAAVGGCCGTDPRFIAALRQRMARRPA
jgi:methionine synthase I (cobalamin-dependent)